MNRLAQEQDWTRLMHAANAGDARAYRRLLESLAPALRMIVRRGLERAGCSAADAEDVVQETLLAIHLKRHTWDSTRELAPWAASIARYKLVDWLRRRGRVATVDVDDLAEVLGDADAPDVAGRIDAGRVLEVLDDRQREIVRSLSIDGESVRDTAARLGMTEVAVRVSLHRTLRRLAARFRDSVSE